MASKLGGTALDFSEAALTHQQQGEAVILVPPVDPESAPDGSKAAKPYLHIVKQPE